MNLLFPERHVAGDGDRSVWNHSEMEGIAIEESLCSVYTRHVENCQG
jgi:hypothetical protein